MEKGVASGYPAIYCTVTTEGVFEHFKDDSSDPLDYFRDKSTFGDCTASPAAALENMRILEEENLLQNDVDMSEYFLDRLRDLQDQYPIIGDIRGKELFLGIELIKYRHTKEQVDEAVGMGIAADCFARGIIGRTNRSITGFKNMLAFGPEFIVTRDEIDEVMAALGGALSAAM